MFCQFMSLLPGSLHYKFFFGYVLCAYLSILGLYRLFYLLCSSGLLTCLSIVLLLGPLDGINVGGNELFYNFLVPSLLAKTFSIWGWYFFFKPQPRGKASYLLWALAALAQPLVGLQCFLLAVAIQGLEMLRTRTWNSDFLVWVVVAGPWLGALLSTSHQTGEVWDLLVFRDAHHYYPPSFPFLHLILLGGLSLWALAVHGWNVRIRYFILLVMAGCIIYTLGIWMHSSFLLKTQWFKTTIWLKALGSAGGLYFVYQLIIHRVGIILGVIILLSIRLWFQPAVTPYHFPWLQPTADEIKIANVARLLTPVHASFIVPFDFSTFRYYSQRSLFVDYKSVAHHGVYFERWQPRIQAIYGLPLRLPGNTNEHRLLANKHYAQLTQEQLKSFPVDFMVTDSTQSYSTWPILATAGRYVLYQIK